MLAQIVFSFFSALPGLGRPSLGSLSWDVRRYLVSNSITAFISQAAFMPQKNVPSQVSASIFSHRFLVNTTRHQTSLVLVHEAGGGEVTS